MKPSSICRSGWNCSWSPRTYKISHIKNNIFQTIYMLKQIVQFGFIGITTKTKCIGKLINIFCASSVFCSTKSQYDWNWFWVLIWNMKTLTIRLMSSNLGNRIVTKRKFLNNQIVNSTFCVSKINFQNGNKLWKAFSRIFLLIIQGYFWQYSMMVGNLRLNCSKIMFPLWFSSQSVSFSLLII